MKVIRILLGITFFILGYVGLRALVRQALGSGGTAYERAFDRALRTQGGYDEFRALVRATKGRQQIQARTAIMTQRGLSLLSIDDQAARIAIIDRFLTTASVPICAAFYRGTGDREAVVTALIKSLDSAGLETFSTMAARAFIAEMRDSTHRPRALTTEEVVQFLDAAGSGLDQKDQTRFYNVLAQFQTANDTEMCWLGRTLYLHVLAQEGAARTQALQMITLIESQEQP